MNFWSSKFWQHPVREAGYQEPRRFSWPLTLPYQGACYLGLIPINALCSAILFHSDDTWLDNSIRCRLRDRLHFLKTRVRPYCELFIESEKILGAESNSGPHGWNFMKRALFHWARRSRLQLTSCASFFFPTSNTWRVQMSMTCPWLFTTMWLLWRALVLFSQPLLQTKWTNWHLTLKIEKTNFRTKWSWTLQLCYKHDNNLSHRGWGGGESESALCFLSSRWRYLGT